jgi:hypothetical protein
MTTDNQRVSTPPVEPAHQLIVLPWLRRPGDHLLLPNWLAITIGKWIFSWRPLNDAELAHELTHVRQWHRYGLRFIPRYLRASWRAAWPEEGDSYRDNKFEVQARAAADAVSRGRSRRRPGTSARSQ